MIVVARLALLGCFGNERKDSALTGGSTSTPPASVDRAPTGGAQRGGANALAAYALDASTRVDTLADWVSCLAESCPERC